MATITKTYTEGPDGSYKSTWTLVFSAPDILVTGASFDVLPPGLTAKFAYSGKDRGEVDIWSHPVINGVAFKSGNGFNNYRSPQAMSSGATYAIGASSAQGGELSETIPTASIFTAANKTVRSVPLQYVQDSLWLWSYKSSNPNIDNSRMITTASNIFSTTPTVTLDVPPTATISAMYYDTGFIYADLTTASVDVSDAAAYYGGDVTDITLQIGSQTASRSTDGTLSIALANAGTFTPTVTVTDSRGQTYVETLPSITVLTYSAPTVSFSAERTKDTGVPDEEGTFATLDATFVFADAIATAVAPSVVMTDENGTQTTPTVTWYSSRAADGTLSGSVTWASLSSGDRVFGLVPGLNTNYSYQIAVRPRDDLGTGTAISQTVASAFYTIDFLAGGHGIAFGKPASNVGFECAMETTFDEDVTFGADLFIDLPDYQTADTTDKSIYDAVVALGWDQEVLS